MKNNYILIRRTFPQVYAYLNPKNGMKYWIGSARSRRWGMDERRHFNSEKEAVDWARQIAKRIEEEGAQPEIAKDQLELAKAYQNLREKLLIHGKTPEEAVAHYLGFLGNEIIRQAKPVLKTLIEKWESEKLASKIRPLSDRSRTELQQYARYMIKIWGQKKAEEITQMVVTDALNNLRWVRNNTRRKYRPSFNAEHACGPELRRF